jgi:hypothetical protein
MKGSMKKLAVFVVIGAIATFIMADIASAWSPGWWPGHYTIWGQYAFTGENTCLIAPLGFNPNLTPINGVGVIQTSSREGVFTFRYDGTGSAHINPSRVVALQIGPTGSVLPSAGTQEITFDFTYTLKDDGTITIVVGPGPFISEALTGPDAGKTFNVEGVSMDGVITPDGESMTLNGGAPDVYTITPSIVSGFVTKSICHGSGVLIRQHD